MYKKGSENKLVTQEFLQLACCYIFLAPEGAQGEKQSVFVQEHGVGCAISAKLSNPNSDWDISMWGIFNFSAVLS